MRWNVKKDILKPFRAECWGFWPCQKQKNGPLAPKTLSA